MKLKTLILAAILMAAFIAPAFSQEMPAPGTTIDKNNYKKYGHLFPEEYLPGFENGWNGVMAPIKVKVVAQTPVIGIPKIFQTLSAKNKGKYQLDGQGNIANFHRGVGLPFPDLDKSDKDFIVKFMWNYDNRYRFDDSVDSSKGGSWEKRRGTPARYNTARSEFIYYVNRLVDDPKPNLENPMGLYTTMVFHYLIPDSVKNTIMLTYRYTDVKKNDDTYMYLPSMRRVLRAEAGQRSTPVLGSTQALDDFAGFDGRTPDFTYTLVKEQKVLAIASDHTPADIGYNWNPKGELWFSYDGWEVRDTYVIDIKPKDSKYPQSRKRIWVDKINYEPYFVVAYDRAGKEWKVWSLPTRNFTLPNGDKWVYEYGQFGIDTQFGMATNFIMDRKMNGNRLTYSDATPASLLKRAR